MSAPEPDPAATDEDPRSWLERYQATPPDAQVPRWPPPLAVALTGVGCAVIAAVTVAPSAAWCGPVAALVVVGFFASSALPLHLVESVAGARGFGLVLLLLNYAVRVGACLLVLAVAVGAGLDRDALGLSVIACAVVRVNVHAGTVALAGRRGRAPAAQGPAATE